VAAPLGKRESGWLCSRRLNQVYVCVCVAGATILLVARLLVTQKITRPLTAGQRPREIPDSGLTCQSERPVSGL
jgi:hypothetical protein